MSEELSVVLGAGVVGRTLVDRLLSEGRPVRVVTRSGRADVPAGVEIVAGDISDPTAAQKVCAGAGVVYGCVGLDYRGWPERWPPMMNGMLAGAEAAGATFVFQDNLYMYGPVDVPMTEDMPLTSYGDKPAARARITRLWQDAHERGRVRAASVRASDFYGPGVTLAAVGERAVGRLAKGKAAQVIGDVDQPHSFTYVPDLARALVTVADADDAMGQAWNVPNAPDITVRQLLTMFAAEFGVEPKIQTMPRFLMTALGLVDPNVRELKEMLFQWDRPFRVDASKFGDRFWADATPFEEGVPVAAASYPRS